MTALKSHFWYNKSQRNGILILCAIIIFIQVLYLAVDFKSDKKLTIANAEIARLQAELNQLKTLKTSPKTYENKPFNPSFLSDAKAYSLGLNTEQINRLLAFREQGKYINSAEEFQQVTGISDSLLKVLKPLFKFPDWVVAKQVETEKENTNSLIKVDDINTASAKDLVKINGVGLSTANRIINYRTELKGFSFNDQLYEVYYLDTLLADKILKQFKIVNKPAIEKLNVNTASFKEILHLPYIDYALTKKIFDYKNEVTEIRDLEELRKIEGFPLDKFDRIALYLKTK
jgi:DNA uptake protein ComE-like DNA-binding protein